MALIIIIIIIIMLYFKVNLLSKATPQPFFDTDFEGLASNAELYIFNQDDSQE